MYYFLVPHNLTFHFPLSFIRNASPCIWPTCSRPNGQQLQSSEPEILCSLSYRECIAFKWFYHYDFKLTSSRVTIKVKLLGLLLPFTVIETVLAVCQLQFIPRHSLCILQFCSHWYNSSHLRLQGILYQCSVVSFKMYFILFLYLYTLYSVLL